MNGGAVHPRVPQRRDEDRGQADRNLEAAPPEGLREPRRECVTEPRRRADRETGEPGLEYLDYPGRTVPW